MKKLLFIFLLFGFYPLFSQNTGFVMSKANDNLEKGASSGTVITINVTAGGLAELTRDKFSTITSLILSGSIDARDFKTMRDSMTSLTDVNLSGATIVSYNGTEGTYSESYSYSNNEIPCYAFHNSETYVSKTNLNAFTFPINITSIDDYAFKNCSGLSHCIDLTTFNIPSTVTSIGFNTFYNCSNLLSLTLHEGLISIGYEAFYNCSKLTSLTLPEGLISIAYGAFSNCSKLKSLTIPSTVNLIGTNAFVFCSELSSITEKRITPVNLSSSGNVFLSVDKTACKLNVPYGSITAYQSANQWKEFTTIDEMPGVFISTNKVAFGPDASTRKIAINSSVEWKAISNQSWLTRVPGSGNGVDSLALTVTALTGSNNRTATITISANGFDNQIISITQYGPTAVTPGNLNTLLSDQLATTTKLILIGSIDARDFKTMRDSMPLLAEIDLSGVTIVAYSGIGGTSSGSYSYSYYNNQIPDNAFSNCSGLSSIILPKGLTSIGNYAFGFCSGLTSLTIPATVTSIGYYAFENCTGLTSVNLSKSLTSIGSDAFNNCSNLTSITIPATVTSIDSYAFQDCSGLSAITVNFPTPIDLSFSYSVFSNVDNASCKLYVPFGTKSAYQAADKWKDFDTIIEKNGLFVSTNSVSFIPEAGTKKIFIASSTNWTAVVDDDWLTIDPTLSEGSDSIAFTVTANTTFTTRTTTVTISAEGYDDQIIAVTQYSVILANAGGLKQLLGDQLAATTYLKLSGTIDARDFKTMRDDMPLLAEIDLSGAKIVAYQGTGGTSQQVGNTDYPANTIPETAFMGINNFGKESLHSIILPNSAIAIGNQAFGHCMKLSSVILPDGLLSIGGSAFKMDHFLKTLLIPASVTTIGSSAFFYCNNLVSITANPIIPIDLSASSDVFFGIDTTTCILHIPIGTLAAYQLANQWKAFMTIEATENVLCVVVSSVDFTSEESDSTVTVISNVPWTVKSNQTWLSVNQGSGSEIGTLTLSATKNTGDIRTAMVTVSSPGVSDKTILVTQAAGAVLPDNYTVTTQTITNGIVDCFNAKQILTVAGGTNTVIFESGSTVTLVAGQSIIFLPGFHAQSGSSLDAHITVNGTFCTRASGSIVEQPAEKSVEEQELVERLPVEGFEKSVTIYPNPNDGQLTLNMTNINSGATVCIYDMLGSVVYKSVTTNRNSTKINLSGVRNGIYLVRVIDGNEQLTRKMIVN